MSQRSVELNSALVRLPESLLLLPLFALFAPFRYDAGMANPTLRNSPLALILLDGFGHSEKVEGNAIKLAQRMAKTPFLDQFTEKYPNTLIEAAGERTGLARDQFGNSEVGHMNIGAGRVVPLDSARIDEAISSGKFFENPALIAAVDAGKNRALHLMGLVSAGGVHSTTSHLHALRKWRRGVGSNEFLFMSLPMAVTHRRMRARDILQS